MTQHRHQRRQQYDEKPLKKEPIVFVSANLTNTGRSNETNQRYNRTATKTNRLNRPTMHSPFYLLYLLSFRTNKISMVPAATAKLGVMVYLSNVLCVARWQLSKYLAPPLHFPFLDRSSRCPSLPLRSPLFSNTLYLYCPPYTLFNLACLFQNSLFLALFASSVSVCLDLRWSTSLSI